MLDIRSEIESVASSLPADDSQSSTTDTTSTETSGESTATPATQEPRVDGQVAPPADDDESALNGAGAIPVARVREILKNARTKAATEVEGRYAWAKELSQEQVAEQKQILGWLDSDPVGFMRFMESQIKADPRYASQLQPATPAAQDLQPEPDVQLSDGSFTYSQGQFDKLFAWRERQMETRFAERFGPIEKAFQEERALASGRSKANEVLTDAKTWPGFADNMDDIRTLMETDKRVTLESAYRRVVVPKLQAQDKDRREALRREILTELKTKPAASTEVPGRVSTSPPASLKGKSTEEIMRVVMSEMGG